MGKVNCIDELLKAAWLLRKNENIRFVLLGEGPLKQKYIEDCKEFKNVVFMNFVPKNKVISVIANATLLVNLWKDLDIYQYGVSPNKWIDYMLCGRPILVTFNGFQSMINEAECGWFIKANNPQLLAEKILEISKLDKETLNQMGQRGKDYILKNCDYKILSGKLLNFIQTV